jgi:hypothetical protein
MRTPRIVLSTLPQERHGLGLLMAEACAWRRARIACRWAWKHR